MSKTFKCVEHEEEVLEVYPFTGEEGGRKFSLLMPHVSSNAGIAFDSTTAPALALAILEAAGHVDASKGGHITRVSNAMYLLQEHIELEAVNAVAEADRVKLEAEALQLCNAHREYSLLPTVATWDGFNGAARGEWLAVARAARELNKEAGNA